MLESYKRVVLALLFGCPLLCTATQAEYYRYKDEQGAIHFTDNPLSHPPKARAKAIRVDEPISPPQQPAPDTQAATAALQPSSPPQMKRARKGPRRVGTPPASPPPLEEGVSTPPERPKAASHEPPDPALSSPLKTIRLFRRSLARGDYTAAAKCLGMYDAAEAQRFIAQMPREFLLKLSEEFTEAVEIARYENEAAYWIGKPDAKGRRTEGRHEVYLRKVGENWKIVR